MADIIPANDPPEPTTEINAELSPEFPQIPAENQANFADKIRGMAQSAFGRIKAKVAGRGGRGRPPNCDIHKGIPINRCPCSLGATDVPAESLGVPLDGAQISREVVTEAVSAVVKAATGTADAFLAAAIVRKTGDRAFAKDTIDRCQPTEKEFASLGILAEICLRKYGVGTEYCPEIGLGAIILGMGSRYALAFKAVADMPQIVIEEKE